MSACDCCTCFKEEDIEKIVTAKHPKGIIITGAKGTGKSTLAVAIVGVRRSFQYFLLLINQLLICV